MKLYTLCNSCSKETSINIGAATRVELENKVGTEFMVNCEHCAIDQKKHVNKIQAKPNVGYTLLATALSGILTVFFWDMGFITTLSFALPVLVWQQQQTLANAFNGYRV